MAYTLYYSPGACSQAVHVVLNEIGADFEAISKPTSEGATRTAEFLKINPWGKIPALVEDGKALFEGGAIITYLCDKHKSPLIPQSGWERAQALQWLMFCNSSLHPAYGRTFWIPKNVPQSAQEETQKAARAQIQEMWDKVEQHLEQQGTPYLAGKECTAGDILLCVIANWNPQNYKFGPKTKTLFKSVTARPSFQKALKTEGGEYKAAA